MDEAGAWRGSWIASRYGDWRHAAPEASRTTLCGMPYVLMREDHAERKQDCPRCVNAARELAADRA